METPMFSSLTDVKGVKFITYKTSGADDFLEYEYEITSFDKIVEFNGNYLIKFIGKIVVDGEDILEKHRMVELDKKYETKAKKK